MPRRRTLRPDEEELWNAVARTAAPMHPKRPVALPETPTAPIPKPKAPLAAFTLATPAPRGHDLAPTIRDQLATQPLRMDAKQFGRMTKGRLAPEARIDLHGMTLSEAHPELVAFILGAFSMGLRLVLVITGKGKLKDDHGPIPQRMGVLRHQVPQWLRLPPLGPVVQQVAEAHLKHGGSGAYYVYLRRK
ncbi:Smr/MutS family protein [Falsirhodobacter xinxiangensis]|uniref:Smr/MutS family protein n=1 Tax=Falsirhodobacter xinxiangensis TaxID=2530049 RepID=UPI0010AACC07|nr:Smr/MutS family protein [Rhodobacter xinxiangensis]